MFQRVRQSPIIAILALLTVLTVVPAWPVHADEKEYEVSHYHVVIEAYRNGTLRITETITFRFVQGSFTYAYRYIPHKGFDDLRLLDVSSNTTEITSLQFKQRLTDYYIKWTYPETKSPAEHTFTITYEVTNALTAPSDLQNGVDWQAVGGGWEVPISDVVVVVQLPVDASPELLSYSPEEEARVYGGPSGTVVVFRHDYLKPGVPYRVVVYFDKVYEPRITLLRLMRDSPITFFGMFYAAVVVSSVVWAWGRRRSLARRVKVKPTYGLKPPSSLKPPEVARLLRPSLGDVLTPLLLDLASRGYVEIEHVKVEKRFRKKDVFKFKVREGFEEDHELEDYEREFLSVLKEAGDTDVLRKQAYRFKGRLLEVCKAVSEKLVSLNLLYKTPPGLKTTLIVYGVLMTPLVLLTGKIVPIDVASALLGPIIGVALGSLTAMFVASAILPRYTLEGLKEKLVWTDYLRRLKEKALTLEGLRDLFNRVLPYLIIVVKPSDLKSLLKTLKSAATEGYAPPPWYYYHGVYTSGRAGPLPHITAAADFSAFLNNLPTLVHTFRGATAVAGGGGAGGGGGGGGAG